MQVLAIQRFLNFGRRLSLQWISGTSVSSPWASNLKHFTDRVRLPFLPHLCLQSDHSPTTHRDSQSWTAQNRVVIGGGWEQLLIGNWITFSSPRVTSWMQLICLVWMPLPHSLEHGPNSDSFPIKNLAVGKRKNKFLWFIYPTFCRTFIASNTYIEVDMAYHCTFLWHSLA